ncbi:MAG: hypothetical protein PF961_07200 [Planctomycetota bacterium]|jgi:hypothetical protein|nr:hypothetical protein [Planctomycetota bacterium]
MRTPIIIAILAVGAPIMAAEPEADTNATIYAFVDILPDDSDLSATNDLGSGDIDGAKWDDHWRAGVGLSAQHLLSEVGGPLLTYGFELGYNRYLADDDESEFTGRALIISPRIGIGFHAFEWLFLEGSAFAGAGVSEFTYRVDPLSIDETSDLALATEYGLQASATFALAETLLLGARVGWIAQQLEGEFEGDPPFVDTTLESDTTGVYYGLLAGLRF